MRFFCGACIYGRTFEITDMSACQSFARAFYGFNDTNFSITVTSPSYVEILDARSAFERSDIEKATFNKVGFYGNIDQMCMNAKYLTEFNATLSPTSAQNAFKGCTSLTNLSIALCNITSQKGMDLGLETCTAQWKDLSISQSYIGDPDSSVEMTLKLPPSFAQHNSYYDLIALIDTLGDMYAKPAYMKRTIAITTQNDLPSDYITELRNKLKSLGYKFEQYRGE